jgi:peptidoglycan hydrolase-like protein with peptidoglycan-binding domain
MSDAAGDTNETSVVAQHAVSATATMYVAPTAGGTFNRLRFPLVPVACWRMNHALFDFDSSFVLPAAKRDFAKLAAILDQNAGAPISIFGHADPVGDDGYNKTLSGRRARAVEALLRRDTGAWEDLYRSPMPGDRWGTRAIQRMLATVTSPADGLPYHAGPPSDAADGATFAAVRAFQKDNGLVVDGDAGPATRKVIFAAYMEALAGEVLLTSDQFLGEGADPDGKGALQGCSEFNPVLLLSTAESAELEASPDKTLRDKRNAPNRRVLVLLFRPGTRVKPDDWPCPRWSESAAGCRAQLWPDGEQRRTATDVERTYRVDHHTMACRFYDRLVRISPCEGVSFTTVKIRLFDRLGRVMPRVDFKATLGKRVVRGTADGDGFVVLNKVATPRSFELAWSLVHFDPSRAPEPDQFEFVQQVFVEANDDGSREGVRDRLTNLGYQTDAPLEECVRRFQMDHGIEPANGDPDDEPTRAQLFKTHLTMTPPDRQEPPHYQSLFDTD